MSKPEDISEEYSRLEVNTLSLLNKMIEDALEDGGESPSASLLGQAVSLLKGAKIPEASSQSSRSASLDTEGWFSDLPKKAKEALENMKLPDPPNSPNAVQLDDEEE